MEGLPFCLQSPRRLAYFLDTLFLGDVLATSVLARVQHINTLLTKQQSIRDKLLRVKGGLSFVWVRGECLRSLCEYCSLLDLPLPRLLDEISTSSSNKGEVTRLRNIFPLFLHSLGGRRVEARSYYVALLSFLNEKIRRIQMECIEKCEFSYTSERALPFARCGERSRAYNEQGGGGEYMEAATECEENFTVHDRPRMDVGSLSESSYWHTLATRWTSLFIDVIPSEECGKIELSSTAFVTFKSKRSACIAQQTLLSEVRT